MITLVEGLDSYSARIMGRQAVKSSKKNMPKYWTARNKLLSVAGDGFFGVAWQDSYLWYQERGIKAFTMNSLKGKTIPMWVTDDDGSLRRQNPKIETKTDGEGYLRVLIFRRASKPGAPGRINVRRKNGQIGKGNVGVKWRHPGFVGRNYIYDALHDVASNNLVSVQATFSVDDEGLKEEITEAT